MMEPQEIEDEEYEQILQRVAAVDVAKASGMVCLRVPHVPGRTGGGRACGAWMPRRTRSWSWPGTWSRSGSRR